MAPCHSTTKQYINNYVSTVFPNQNRVRIAKSSLNSVEQRRFRSRPGPPNGISSGTCMESSVNNDGFVFFRLVLEQKVIGNDGIIPEQR